MIQVISSTGVQYNTGKIYILDKYGKLKVPTGTGSAAWGSITGTLSSQTDLQIALDGKVDENTAITGDTKTKITYDSKGLVTAGADAGIADITGLQSALDAKFDLEDINPICKLGENINKGQAVYVSSATGTNMVISKASNTLEATSSKTFGLLSATGVTNDQIRVITSGFLAGLDTSTAGSVGDPVWLGTSGNLIYGLVNKPYAPAHLVFIGIVTRKNNSNGEIYIKVQNGFELKEIHDVDLITTTPVNGDILGYNGTLWVNKTIASWLGYTPYNGTTNPNGYIDSSSLTPYLTSTTAASTYLTITNAASTYYLATNPNSYITSSALTPYLTITSAASTYQPIGTYATATNSMTFSNKSGNISQWTNDSGYITSSSLSPYLTSATAASTYQTILSAASASSNGYLTSTDWSTFNSKLTSSTQLLFGSLNLTFAGAASPTTRWHTIAGGLQTSSVNSQIPLSVACTFSNFYFRTYGSQPATGSLVLTLQKNGTDTASTITIASGSAANNFTDNTNTVSFAVGDTWQLKLVQNATSSSTGLSGYSFKMTI